MKNLPRLRLFLGNITNREYENLKYWIGYCRYIRLIQIILDPLNWVKINR